MVGQAETQPTDGELTLSGLAAELDVTEGEETPELDEGVSEDAPDVEDESESEESDDAEEEDEDAEEEATVTLKHDGKEVTLKQSEAIELAQKGFDYTQKTMAVAEERKVVEAEKAKAAEFRQQLEKAQGEAMERLQSYASFIESQIGTPPPIELAQRDAAQYLAQKELYESRKGQLQQAGVEFQRLQQEQARYRQAWLAQEAEATERALRDTLPGWNDAKVSELAEYAVSNGLKPDEVDVAFVKKGFWELLHKAKAYDAIQAKKAELKPKAQLTKVAKPAATSVPNRSEAKRAEAMKRYAANPSLNTLADLIE